MWKFSELEYKRPDVDELVKLITDTTEAVKNSLEAGLEYTTKS